MPFLAVGSFPILVLLASGEILPVDRMVRIQERDSKPILIGLAYSNPVCDRKLKYCLDFEPDIVILGSSRALQFRSKFFSGCKFYNMAGGFGKIQDFMSFVRRIPKGKEPKVILMAPDQWYFNSTSPKGGAVDVYDDYKPNFEKIFVNFWTQTYTDYWQRKFTLSKLIFPRRDGVTRIGLGALFNGNGFRKDGSYAWIRDESYPTIKHDGNESVLKSKFGVFVEGLGKKKEPFFEYDNEVAPAALEEARSFLAECKARGIHVVGFLPPYPHVVYEKIRLLPQDYGYMLKLGPELTSLFDEFGFSFFDLTDLASTGASDWETFDVFHASEKAALRSFILMAEKDKVLAGYADLNYLRKRLADEPGDYNVFRNEY